MQRGNMADPILAFDLHGNLLRSWGRGDFILPHSLRLDDEGNVWAVDAGASLVIKYSPAGKKLLTIVVGQTPETGSPFRGATDVAFAPNRHVLIADGFWNIPQMVDGCGSGGVQALDRANFIYPMRFRSAEMESFMWLTGRTDESKSSTCRESS
jgi:hypothetical protein